MLRHIRELFYIVALFPWAPRAQPVIAPQSWAPVGGGVSSPPGVLPVHAFSLVNETLFVVGDFTSVGSQPWAYVASWNGSVWYAPPPKAPTSNVNCALSVVSAEGGGVALGGNFMAAGGLSANGLIFLTPRPGGVAAWSTFGSGLGWSAAHGNRGGASALANIGSCLAVGGFFEHAGGLLANNLALWCGDFGSTSNDSSWVTVGGGGGSNGVNGPVLALAVSGDGTKLFIGGDFSACGPVGGAMGPNDPFLSAVAMWVVGGQEIIPMAHGFDDTVMSFLVLGTRVFAGGYLARAYNGVTTCLTQSTAIFGVVQLICPPNQVITDFVFASVGDGGGDCASGFTPGSCDVDYRAIMASACLGNNTCWYNIVQPSPSCDPSVLQTFRVSVACNGNATPVSDYIDTFGIAEWGGSSWISVGGGLPSGIVAAIASSLDGDTLYLGGASFATAGDVNVSLVARYDLVSKTWGDLSGGLDGIEVRAIHVDEGGLVYFGGLFSNVASGDGGGGGGQPLILSNIAIFNDSLAPPLIPSASPLPPPLPPSSPSTTSTTGTTIVIASSASLAAILLCAVVVFCCWKRTRRPTKSTTSSTVAENETTIPLIDIRSQQLSENDGTTLKWEDLVFESVSQHSSKTFSASLFSADGKSSIGSAGRPAPLPVTVKILQPSTASASEKRSYYNEADLQRQASFGNQNVVAFKGLVIGTATAEWARAVQQQQLSEPPDLIGFVTERTEDDLFSLLERERSMPIEKHMALAQKLTLLADIASGISRFHRGQRPIVHGDLRPQNVRLDRHQSPKLSGFSAARWRTSDDDYHVTSVGSSRMPLPRSTSLLAPAGQMEAWRYRAPELDNGAQLPSLLSDMFAFGTIMAEVLTGEKPWAALDADVLHREHRRLESLTAGTFSALKFPPTISPELQHLIRSCMSPTPPDRPTSDAACVRLREASSSIAAIDAPFDVFFSVVAPEDDRLSRRVRAFFSALTAAGLRVWCEDIPNAASLAGIDSTVLQLSRARIINRSRLAVVFVSKEYRDSPFAMAEVDQLSQTVRVHILAAFFERFETYSEPSFSLLVQKSRMRDFLAFDLSSNLTADNAAVHVRRLCEHLDESQHPV